MPISNNQKIRQFTSDWDINHTGGDTLCTSMHGGTSAAAPLASGVYALVLSIRPDLNWRDIQHLSVRTAVTVNPTDGSWRKTAAGRMYSHKFGYGRLDAYAIVEDAKTWTTVNPQVNFSSKVTEVNKAIPQGEKEEIRTSIEITQKDVDSVNMTRLEHITVTINIDHARRGDVSVNLVSPNNVISNLLVARQNDGATSGFHNWTVMTVAHWYF
jgi:kexin